MSSIDKYDDEFDSDNEDIQINRRSTRKSKLKCAKLLSSFNNNLSDSNNETCEESDHDSFNDPEFQAGSDEEDDISNETDDDNDSDNDSEVGSIMSELTEFNDTINMLKDSKAVINIPTDVELDLITMNSKNPNLRHNVSKKQSEHLVKMMGAAENFIWNQKFVEAQKVCEEIHKENPYFYGYYKLMDPIFEHQGNFKMRNKCKYYSCLFDKTNVTNWLDCISCYEHSESVEKAIEITKKGLQLVTDRKKLREKLVELLSSAGDEREELKQRLYLCENRSILPKTKDEIQNHVEELCFLKEKFESLKDNKRSASTALLLCTRYPDYCQNQDFLKLVTKLMELEKYKKIISVAKHIEGVFIKMTNFTQNERCLRFDDAISGEIRHNLIYAVLFSILVNECETIMNDKSYHEYMCELVSDFEKYMKIVGIMFEKKYYKAVILYSDMISDKCNKKDEVLKLKAQCLERLGYDQAALDIYDSMLTNVTTNLDGHIWQLKVNLLYKIGRETEARQVLEDSVNTLRKSQIKNPGSGVVVNWDNPGSTISLLHALAEHYSKNNQTMEYKKALWRYIFLDIVGFLKTYGYASHLETCAELESLIGSLESPQTGDMVRLQHRLSTCYKTGIDDTSTRYRACLATVSEQQNWHAFQQLRHLLLVDYENMMEDNGEENNANNLCCILELLSLWGIILCRLMNWSKQHRNDISATLISVGVRGRLDHVALRARLSHDVLMWEIHRLCKKNCDSDQYWNFYNFVCNLVKETNLRVLLRLMPLTENDSLHFMNAAFNVNQANKLSLTLNSKLYQKYPKNPQILLQMAIIFMKSALSRNCKDPLINFTYARLYLFSYIQQRGLCQETYLNMGLFYARCNLLTEAVDLFMKCCDTEPVGETPEVKEMYDLSMSAAYNLSLICKKRGTARYNHYVQKYLVM